MKKVIISIATIAILISYGCEDFLVEKPLLGASDNIILSNYKGLNSATAGVYTFIASTEWYGADYLLNSEMRSGNGKRNLDYQSGRSIGAYNWNYSPSGTSAFWGRAYQVVAAVNKVLENLEGKAVGEVTEQDLNNLKAECLFMRAFAHFDLVRLYAQSYTSKSTPLGVPYVKTTDPTLKPARNTVAEVFDFIVEDLLEAEKVIDPNYKRTGVVDPKATVTLPAIQALLSRAYLYMEKWQECANYATKVINNKSFTMWEADDLEKVWTVDVPTNGEVIFEMYGARSNSFDGYWEGIQWMTSPGGYGDCATSADLVSLYEDGDVRRDLFKSPDDDPDLYWTKKYNGKGKGTPDTNNTIILRLSEMYLNRAEALVNGANIAGVSAVNDLNVITSNRGAETYKSAGREDVFVERRKELAWEGHLLFDLSRLGRPLERNDYTGDAINKNIDYPNYKWALPISQAELDVNPNLVQNPGY